MEIREIQEMIKDTLREGDFPPFIKVDGLTIRDESNGNVFTLELVDETEYRGY